MNKGLYFTLRYTAMTLAGCGAVVLATSFYGVSRFQANHLGDLPFMADMVQKAGHPPPAERPQNPTLYGPSETGELPAQRQKKPRSGNRRIAPAKRPGKQPTIQVQERDIGEGQWGVVLGRGAKYYNSQGKFQGRLEGGALVDITDTKSTKQGEMAVCKIKKGGPAVIIERRNLEIWPGDISKIPDELRTLVSKTGKIEARMQTLEYDLKKEHKEKCPDYRAYRKAADAYSEFYDRTQVLMKKRDQAEGAKRTKFADMLQKMKNEGIPLEAAYKSAQTKMKRWQRDNPQPQSSDDQRMRKLLQELATTRHEIETKYQ